MGSLPSSNALANLPDEPASSASVKFLPNPLEKQNKERYQIIVTNIGIQLHQFLTLSTRQ